METPATPFDDERWTCSEFPACDLSKSGCYDGLALQTLPLSIPSCFAEGSRKMSLRIIDEKKKEKERQKENKKMSLRLLPILQQAARLGAHLFLAGRQLCRVARRGHGHSDDETKDKRQKINSKLFTHYTCKFSGSVAGSLDAGMASQTRRQK